MNTQDKRVVSIDSPAKEEICSRIDTLESRIRMLRTEAENARRDAQKHDTKADECQALRDSYMDLVADNPAINVTLNSAISPEDAIKALNSKLTRGN